MTDGENEYILNVAFKIRKELFDVNKEFFPDGITPVDDWFYNYDIPKLCDLGTQYKITDYGAMDDGKIHTAEIQAAIDHAYENGGGVVVVPRGTYISGSLFFKAGVNLYLEEGATLFGSDDISDYKLCDTRLGGKSLYYFAALINADHNDGFTLCGKGCVDGNGERAWKAFWLRMKWNKNLAGVDEQRARLLYVSNSSNVTIAEATLKNSQFWSTHIYKCDHVRYLGCTIQAPHGTLRAPCSDAIDIDACHDVLIKGCRLDVNDDSVVLKGGKGDEELEISGNGDNQRIIVEDCSYGYCHGVLTFGSESMYDKNIIIRRCNVEETIYMLWFKLRTDTRQHYEYVRMEDVHCEKARSFLKLGKFGDEGKLGLDSMVNHVTMKNCSCNCSIFYDVTLEEDTQAHDFTLENITVNCNESRFDRELVKNTVISNVVVNGAEL